MTQTLRRPASHHRIRKPRPATPGSTPPRRRRVGVWIALVAVLAATYVAVLAWRRLDDRDRHYLRATGWPVHGQAAYQLDGFTPATSPAERPVPIASLAKVMTAYLVLRRHPLSAGAAGPTLTLTHLDVSDTQTRRGQDQSVVAVRAGERLSERQALMALLLPSANNIAVVLARWSAGSVNGFVADMNATARRLGMTHTRYTDPSGFDVATLSTAADQLVLARTAAGNRQLAAMMQTPSFRLPVAGTVHNTDSLLGTDGFLGMKTGSDDAAGGCFMFRVHRVVDHQDLTLVGVVLGQPGHNLITAALTAAQQLADRVVRAWRAP